MDKLNDYHNSKILTNQQKTFLLQNVCLTQPKIDNDVFLDISEQTGLLRYIQLELDDAHFIENDYDHIDSFIKHVEDFITYITNNAHYITNYGERQRNGEVFTSIFAESTINEVVARRFCKKQQMQWSKKGAHLMLQARTKVLNGDLVTCFKKWYPNLKIEQEEVKEAA